MTTPICAHCGAALPLPLSPQQRGCLARGYALYCPGDAGQPSPCQRAANNAREAARYERFKAPQRNSPQSQRESRTLYRVVRRRLDHSP